MLASIMRSAPEILGKKDKDGSTFRASETFVRKWLHDALDWSKGKGTRAAHKLPEDWEDQRKHSCLRKVYVVKEKDIPAKL